jgi:threonine/homoserine/homoserine lactone efflux protein
MIGMLWGVAIVSAAIAFGLKLIIPGFHVVIRGIVVLGVYVLLYIGCAIAVGIPEASDVIRTIRRYLLGR